PRDAGVDTDPLNELTNFERGLDQYCYDRNCVVEVIVGEDRHELELFSDISLLLLDELPAVLGEIERGNTTQLELIEVHKSIGFIADSGKVRVVLEEGFHAARSGQNEEATRYSASKENVLDTLRRLIGSVLDSAVQEGYVTRADADTYLA